MAWHALADPRGVHPWPNSHPDLQPWNDLATGLELLAFGTGWPRLDVGMQRWRDEQYAARSPVLELAAEVLGDRVDGLAVWLTLSSHAHKLEEHIADVTGSPPPGHRAADARWAEGIVDHATPDGLVHHLAGGDGFHLMAHGSVPVDPVGDPSPIWLFDDGTPPRGLLRLDRYAGWYRELTQRGNTLPAHPSGRSWRITVVCEPVGHLGEFRRSRTSGRWFRDDHATHQMGIA